MIKISVVVLITKQTNRHNNATNYCITCYPMWYAQYEAEHFATCLYWSVDTIYICVLQKLILGRYCYERTLLGHVLRLFYSFHSCPVPRINHQLVRSRSCASQYTCTCTVSKNGNICYVCLLFWKFVIKLHIIFLPDSTSQLALHALLERSEQVLKRFSAEERLSGSCPPTRFDMYIANILW